MHKRFLFTLSVIITILAFILASFLPGVANPVYACYTWGIGQRVGLKGGTQIRTGPGFGYTVHTTLPPDANNWLVDIIDGPRYADGQEWWDISRKNIDGGGTGWVYIAQAGWDLCGTNPPGNIYVASGLELQPDPNHSWPPYEGDKLIGRFTLGNNGGQTIHLDGYGVRLRRNSTDYWDFLNNNGLDLGVGQTVRFDQNNERPLSTGHYRAEITWKVSGQDWQVSNAQEFDVAARPGNIYVAAGLELQPDPNHTWPPYEGDKLIGRFTLGNNGGSSVRITGYGVRLRRNSTDYWDFLNTNALDLQPGQTVRFDQNNERPLAIGHYRAEITWQVNGGTWQVTNGTEFDVAARPGNIYVTAGLELQPDPNHSWPPYEGDKLIGRFTLGNNGGSAVRITGYGVRMRRNSTDYWDFLNTNAFDLQAGQTARFDQNNERPLATGHYRAEITWQVNGGTWQVANAIEFDVAAQPVNIYVAAPLELVSDPNHSWPPVEGDKLIGRFTLGNNGGQNIFLEGYGVRLRRNSTDYWDFLNMSGSNLAPGATTAFNQNNERPLLAGHYRAEITWKATGKDWQVANPIEFDVQSPTPGTTDNAEFVGQSNYPTVPAGKNFQIWFEVKNSGTSIWSDSSGYWLENINGQPLGTTGVLALNSTVKPGESFRWNIILESPNSTGVYRTQWMMKHNGAGFGPSMYIDVNVTNQETGPIDLRITTTLSLPVANLEVNHFTTATFTVTNYGSTTANISGLTAAGRGPGGDYDIQDFPWMNGISIAPGQSFNYTSRRSFTSDGRYRFFPVARTWDGQYIILGGPNGEAINAYLRVSRFPLVFATNISVLYQDNANEAVDVTTFFPRPQADGSFIVNVRIINKTKLAMGLYINDLGAPTYDPRGELDVPFTLVPPTKDPDYGGVILHDITFKPDSELNLIFSAYGTETTLGGDGSILWGYNILTLLCMYAFGDVCPSDIMDGSIQAAQEILGEFKGNLFTFSKSYSITEGLIKLDGFGLIRDLVDIFKEHPQWLANLASKIGIKGLTATSVKAVLGSWQLQFFLAYPQFLQFSRDLGRSRWLGVVEVRLLPTLKPNPYLFPGAMTSITTEKSDTEATKPPISQSDGPDSLQIKSALSSTLVDLNTVQSSSGAFGQGWEYFRLIDGSYETGWTNGGDLNSNVEWVNLELGDGQPVILQQILVHPGPVGGDDPSLALKDFAVDYSYDGKNFGLLFEGSFSTSELGNAKIFNVNPVLAHQIRLRAITNQGGTTPAKISVAEIAVGGAYGVDEDAYEPDDILEDATLLPINRPASHVINHADDWDCHSVALVAGVNYTLFTTGLAPVTDTVLHLYGPDGAWITNNDDYGGRWASKIFYTPDRTGLHFLCVYQYGRTAGGPGYTYQIEVTENSATNWYGEYYNNDHFEGSPVLTRRDESINFEWLDGSPDPLIPADHFSVRWARVVNLEAGFYTFSIGRDDGMQIWIDGNLIYSYWDINRTFDEVSIPLAKGNHLIQIDAYENEGWAQAKFSWEVAPFSDVFLPAIKK